LAEVRALVRLAWPVVLGQLGFTLLGIVDVAMVGRLGELELAALAAGHLWTFGVLIPGMALMLGLDPIFTQAHGANEPRAMGRTLWRAMLLVVLCSVPIIVGHIYAEEGLRLLQQPEEALDIAAGYSRALAWSVPGILVFQALRQYLLAMGRMMLPTLAVLAANVLNIGLNYALIEGRFGFPAMGAVGCGWATTAVRLLLPAVLLVLGWGEIRSRLPALAGLFRPAAVWALARQALPVSGQISLEVWAFNAVGVLMGWLGTGALAAHSVALNLSVVAWMVIFGIAAAATTRIGNRIGAGLDWVRTAWTAVGLGTVVMSGSAALLLAFPGPLVSVFTKDPGVLAVTLTLLPLAALFQLFDGVQGVIAGALRGAGDVRVPALLVVVCFWCIGIPAAWWLGIHLDGGPRGVWWGLVLSLILVACALVVRLWWVGRRGVDRVVLADA
jgi:multidrug resistance protein, MATE family